MKAEEAGHQGGRGLPRKGAGRRLRRAGLIAAGLLAAAPCLFVVAAWAIPFPERLLADVSVSPAMYGRGGELLRVFQSPRGELRIPIALEDVSPYVVDATVAAEDRRFWSHAGVDPWAVARAAWQDASSLRIISGASTITMQVVRMLAPRPRGVWTKIVEMFRALQLERRLAKDEILALYLNLAPYGGNLYGIEAAVRAYFGVPAKALGLPEAALLAGIPQSPGRLRPDRFLDRALERRGRVLAAMAREGLARAEDAASCLAGEELEGVPDSRFPRGPRAGPARNLARRPLPFMAPHTAALASAESPGERELRTTLDLTLQKRVEELLRAAVGVLTGVTNAACVVLDNADAAVLAYTGSVDFWSRRDSGQVDGARAYRSPGSTLKPLLYAYAYGKRLLAPDEQLADIPLGTLAWQPENFDRSARGFVNAQEALRKSYNLTAVRLLRRVGDERFRRFLAEAGILKRLGAAPGLALILGASELRLIDLAAAYSALARGGAMRTPHILAGGNGGGERVLFTPEACHLVNEALTGTPFGAARPEGFACKTGTSWGRRDAWAIAYTPRFTVGLWVGNFSGESSPSLVGAEAARPCAIEILSWLDPRPSWPAPPPGIRAGLVCAETGLAAGPWCPAKVRGRLLAGDARVCEVHGRHAVDARSGALLCAECMAGREVVWKVFAKWPADIEAYLRARGKSALPAHEPSCAAIAPGGPVFASPSSGRRYAGAGGTVPVKVLSESAPLYFFLDGEVLAEAGPEFVLAVVPGRHVLACSDGEGRAAKVSFECVPGPE